MKSLPHPAPRLFASIVPPCSLYEVPCERQAVLPEGNTFERIGRGRTTREIAVELHLSIHTIESHREKIRLKLNLRNGTELQQRAVLWALENSR